MHTDTQSISQQILSFFALFIIIYLEPGGAQAPHPSAPLYMGTLLATYNKEPTLEVK